MSEKEYINTYSDKAILQQIGRFVKQQRIQKGLTQHELAARAAMSRSTLSLMERGENIVMINLIKALRILEALHVFTVFKTPPLISPFLLAEAERKQRKRVRRKTKNKNASDNDIGW
ncbi:MAG: helix-turn-helix domain-containing protein [Chitinophagales bacterium]|nr:helix-turn-helix domain-containing protein [Chitinophagales bacterium]MDW8418737.1 helix-turn-helix transcriptional regulator [Chitinophagales bacterium]